MASKTQLDQPLLERIADKRGKTKLYIRQQICKQAARLSISSEASQILMAKRLGIGHAQALRKLEPHIQLQVRDHLPLLMPEPSKQGGSRTSKATTRSRTKDPISAAIDYLISDEELKSRCTRLLKSRKHHDTVFREATTVLENRIKSKARITGRIDPAPLVDTALNPNLSRAILIFSDEASEQQGFHHLCKGIVLAFRHEAHHNLDDDVSQVDALRFCSFIDILLVMLDRTRLRVESDDST